MRKKILALFIGAVSIVKGQVLFSDRCNGYSLQTYTTGSSSTTYTTVAPTYTLINDIYGNNVGTAANNPNRPFNVPALKNTAWAVLYNQTENDTFYVSTSWIDSTSYSVDRWIVTPFINNITANTVLSWDAKSPDPVYTEGYEVYVTTLTGPLLPSVFSVSDRVFSLADGNTTGLGEKTTWTKHGVSLANYAGQNVRIAFRDNSKNMYQLWLDNIKVENIANAFDAQIGMAWPVMKYNLTNTNGIIKCNITNKGNTTINNITLNYSISGIGNVTEGLSPSQPILPYGNSDFTFNTPYNISTPGNYKLKVWVGLINGGNTDQNNTNDTLTSYLTIMSAAPQKSVMVEQFVSAYDGNTPDGQDQLNGLLTGSVVAVNIHDGDSMQIAAASPLISAYRTKTTTALIDRNYFYDIATVPVEKASYLNRVVQRLAAIVPVTVSVSPVSYNSLTRVASFTVNATFTGEVKGDYRINAYITENTVYGRQNDASYNGWNQLSFMYNTPWSAYYQTGYYYAPADGYVMDAFKYRHSHVLEAAPDGPFGVTGSIPTNGGTAGQTFSKAYSYTVPTLPASTATLMSRYNPDDLYIVGFVEEYNTDPNDRNILNCSQAKLTTNPELVGVKEFSVDSKLFDLYPNPSYGQLSILIPEHAFGAKPEVSITDMLGKQVYAQKADITFGLLQLDLSQLANGAYYIRLEGGGTSGIKKLVIAR